MKRLLWLSMLIPTLLMAASCGLSAGKISTAASPTPLTIDFSRERPAGTDSRTQNSGSMILSLKIGEETVPTVWKNNASVDALQGLAENGPLTIRMSMYGGFEQVGSLPGDLPRDDARMTAIPGDIVLYSGNQLVIFYGSNTWAYTKLGRITNLDADKLKALLGNGDISITLSIE